DGGNETDGITQRPHNPKTPKPPSGDTVETPVEKAECTKDLTPKPPSNPSVTQENQQFREGFGVCGYMGSKEDTFSQAPGTCLKVESEGEGVLGVSSGGFGETLDPINPSPDPTPSPPPPPPPPPPRPTDTCVLPAEPTPPSTPTPREFV